MQNTICEPILCTAVTAFRRFHVTAVRGTVTRWCRNQMHCATRPRFLPFSRMTPSISRHPSAFSALFADDPSDFPSPVRVFCPFRGRPLRFSVTRPRFRPFSRMTPPISRHPSAFWHTLEATSSVTERQRGNCYRCFTLFSMTGSVQHDRPCSA